MFNMLKHNRLRVLTVAAVTALLGAALLLAIHAISDSSAQTSGQISLNTPVSFPVDI